MFVSVYLFELRGKIYVAHDGVRQSYFLYAKELQMVKMSDEEWVPDVCLTVDRRDIWMVLTYRSMPQRGNFYVKVLWVVAFLTLRIESIQENHTT